MKRLVGMVLVLTLFFAGTSHAATTGVIDGAEMNAEGTVLKIRGISVTWDVCGNRSGGTILCGAVAEVTSETCSEERGAGTVLWDYDVNRFSPGTVQSGPLEIGVSQPTGYNVCLYGLREESYGELTAESSYLIAQVFVPPPRGATEGEALSHARRALTKKYKVKFKKGTKKKLRCVEQKPREFRCTVRWKYRKSFFSGLVWVRGAAAAPSIAVSVKRR